MASHYNAAAMGPEDRAEALADAIAEGLLHLVDNNLLDELMERRTGDQPASQKALIPGGEPRTFLPERSHK